MYLPMSGSQQYLMASMASQGSSENGSTEYYHALIQNVAQDTLILDEGENWLRLVVTTSGIRHVLEDTQDTILAGTPYPSIISLKEVGYINAPSSNCFVCIDVDGPFVAVKDMRPLRHASQEGDDDDDDDDDNNGVNLMKFYIQRRKFPVDEDYNDNDEDDEDDTLTNYHPLEALPRRQLRILCPGDRICTQTQSIGTNQFNCGLILKYQRRKSSDTKCSELQESTRDIITRQVAKEHITSVEALERHDRHIKQNEKESTTSQIVSKIITHRSQKSTIRKSTVKAATESSDDEMDDDDTDRTQIFPTPDIYQLGTQSPIMAIVNGANGEKMLVEKESPTESMDQSTQPFSYDDTSKLHQLIVANERIHKSRRSESCNDVDTFDTSPQFMEKTDKSIEYGSNEKANVEFKVSVETEIKLGMKISECIDDAYLDKPCRLRDIDDSDASTVLHDDDVARPEGDNDNKVIIDKGQKVTDVYTYKRQESELVTVGEILVLPPRCGLADGRLNEMSAKVDYHTTTDKIYSLYSNDGDESSVTTVLSDNERSDHALAKEKKFFEVENTVTTKKKEQKSHVATVIVAEDPAFAFQEINAKKKGTVRTFTGSNRRKKLVQRKCSKVDDEKKRKRIPGNGRCSNGDEILKSVSTSLLKSKNSQVKLEKPNLWESPVKPGDTGHHDSIDDVSSSSDTLEIQSGLTSLNANEEIIKVVSERNRKVQQLAKDVSSTIHKSKAYAKKERTTTEVQLLNQETSFQLTANALSNPAARPGPSKAKITNLSPSHVTTGSISAISETISETQDNTRTSTPKPAKMVGTATIGSSSQNSRKRARQEGIGFPIRVLITGVDLIPRHKHMIAAIGGELIESVEEARNSTHVIAGDDSSSLRRTPKVMIGICTTSNIVHMDWLTTSAKKRLAQPCRDFLLLNDTKAEMAYDFNMRETLSNGLRMRKKGISLLNGKSVVICQGVAGNMAPPENELKLIVEAAGGQWINASALEKFKSNQAIIITSNPATKRQISTKDIAKAIKHGIQHRPTSWLFDCIMKQQLSDLEE